MNSDDAEILISPLSQSYSDDGLTVDVQIYRLDGNAGWTLEVVASEELSLVWADTFETENGAWEEFMAGAVAIGLRSLLGSESEDTATIY